MLVEAVQVWVKPEVDPPSVGALPRGLWNRSGVGTDQLSITAAAPSPPLHPGRTKLPLVPLNKNLDDRSNFWAAAVLHGAGCAGLIVC